LAQDALSRPVPAREAAELQCRLAHILLMGGRADLATVAAEAPLAGADLPAHVRENAEAARIVALSLLDPEQAARLAREVLGDRDRRDGDAAVVTAGAVLSNLLWDTGDLTESLRLARDSVAGIRSGTPASWRTNARLVLARKLSNRREFADAEQLIRQAEADSGQLGLTVHSAAPAVAHARLLSQAGRLDEARAEAVAALASARELGAQLLTPLATSVLAFVSLRSGDLLAAADYIRRYRTDLDTGISPVWSVQYDWLELLLTAEQDGPRRAVDLLDGPHAGLVSRPVLFAEEPGAAAWLVRLALAVGDHQLAEVTLATAERLAADNPDFAALRIGAVHARGLVDRDPAALDRAAEEHRDSWARALAAEDRAGYLAGRRRGGTAAAVSALELALRTFEEIGAQRDSARIRNRLRALGVRRRPLPGPRCGSSGWVSLSDTERTISHLVNQGLTNRQIAKRVYLSPHTVNYHLRQIFRKLGITSRVELARVTQEQHLAPGHIEPPDSAADSPGRS
jgi:ATP/maltotriose-dependent transcriptional regulator MalT